MINEKKDTGCSYLTRDCPKCGTVNTNSPPLAYSWKQWKLMQALSGQKTKWRKD